MMNGERLFIVMSSRPAKDRFSSNTTTHTILQITGKKVGRIMTHTEYCEGAWDTLSHMLRLDA